MRALPCLLLALLPMGWSYLNPMTISNSSGPTVTNFLTDLGACSCNLSSACDPFCCCDPACSSEQVAVWQGSNWCESTSGQIEKYCAEMGTRGFGSFEELGCVVYSNRAAIGEYYAVPGAVNIIDPNTPKL